MRARLVEGDVATTRVGMNRRSTRSRARDAFGTHAHTLAVADVAGATLSLYLRGSKLPPELEKRVGELAALRVEMAALDAETGALRERLGDAAARAGELRENLRALEKTPRAAALQKQIVDRLAAATKEVDELSQSLATKALAQAAAKAKLGELVRGLT